MFPKLPAWDGIHPLIVHFPIALLLFAPVLIVLGLFMGKNRQHYWISALVMMVAGTIGIYLAYSSGLAALDLVDRTPEIEPVLNAHQEISSWCRLLFTGLTVVLAAIVFVPILRKQELAITSAVPIAVLFLVVYFFAGAKLAESGHDGARLVHEFGVQALMDAPSDHDASKQ